MILVQAHRGASAYAPENTLPAFELAVEMKADGVENDIHLTRDMKYVVNHDHTIDRTSTGTGIIEENTYEYLNQYDYGMKFNEKFKGTKLPLLEEFMEIVKDMEVINIELKASLANFDKAEGFRLLYDIIRAYKCQERVVISCFNHQLVKEFKEQIGKIRIGLLYGHQLGPDETLAMAKAHLADFIHPHHGVLNKEIIDKCRDNGIGTNIWTVDSLDDIERALEMNPTGIITNVPDRVLKALGR